MNLIGKTCLVTGSTDGIGRHTAQRLARDGYNILIHGRNPQRVSDTVDELSKNAKGQIKGFVADLAHLDDIQRLATEVKDTLNGQPLHVLINNAGVYMKQMEVAGDGKMEFTFAVNVAAPFLLTSLLLDTALFIIFPTVKNENAVSERIVNTSSTSASSDIDFNNLQQERGFSSDNSYSLSKLCNQLFNHQLASRLGKTKSAITANTLDPGTVNTKLLKSGWGTIGIPLSEANDEYWVATEPSLSGRSGLYFVGCRERRSPGVAYDEEVQMRLWGVLEELTDARWSI